jgi:hypothetical protein
MTDIWLTTMSTNPEAVVNPLAAACRDGFVPDALHVLNNPGVDEEFDDFVAMMRATVAAHGDEAPGDDTEADEPTVETTSIADETDFRAIVEHFREPIRDASDADRVAVDVTPGRKFMSALAFQSGVQFGAAHVFYLYVSNTQFYGRLYPDMPRPASELVDFTEVF